LPEEDVEGRVLGEETLGGGDHCRGGGDDGPIADMRTGEDALLGELGGDTVDNGLEFESVNRGKIVELLEGREPNWPSGFNVCDSSNPEKASSKDMP